MAEQPLIFTKTADQVTGFLRKELMKTGWSVNPDAGVPRPGEAMVQIFGRLSELIIQRLNQLPEKYFLAFLNEAGVDLLPPRPARSEVVLNPSKDAANVTRVAAGTQVATKKTEIRPEIVFETERDINVVKASLSICLAVDPVKLSDRSAIAKGDSSGSYKAFAGEVERDRVLYFADASLFCFADDAGRVNATLTLDFSFSSPGRPDLDGWRLHWLYYDGSTWQDLIQYGKATIEDTTADFSTDGTIHLKNLPQLCKYVFADKNHESWLACRLTGGSGRAYLPEISGLVASRIIDIPLATPQPADLLISAIHAGSALLPLPVDDEFFPFGQGPARLDAFYLRSDEAFAKVGATVELSFDLVGLGVSDSGQELTNLRVEWAYASTDGWHVLGISSRTGVTGTVLDFSDATLGFTNGSNGLKVSFTVPSAEQSPFSKIKVGKEEGLWLRARIISGGFWADTIFKDVRIPVARPPLVKKLTVGYRNYQSAATTPAALYAIHSQVDQIFRPSEKFPLSPFMGKLDVPALYLGFTEVFPPGEWLQLLIDVDEERGDSDPASQLWWEYWDGEENDWQTLPVSDQSFSLSRRGYLGFYGPEGQQQTTLFGTQAAWLRVRPHVEPPIAVAPADLTLEPGADGQVTIKLDGSASSAVQGLHIANYRWTLQPPQAGGGGDQSVTVTGDEGSVTLDASASALASGRDIVCYHWTLVSSSHLIPQAGPDITVSASGSTATLTLDASGSTDVSGAPLARYLWRRSLAAESVAVDNEAPVPLPSPYLKSIRSNIVPVVNAITINEELLGSGNGKGGQSFVLFRPPILDQVALYVRETDQPSADDLRELEKELSRAEETGSTTVFALTQPASAGIWVRWCPVEHFYGSGPTSRHFDLDRGTGAIVFGDGERGRVLPPGRDNIKVLYYRTHQGGQGNVAAADIRVLRNPTGPLATIKKVTNPWAASGGTAAETVGEVRRRGPRSLKHRGKAVTIEDFAWLARDASGEVARAWCLPTRDVSGLTHAGWVTLVVIPATTEDKPFPSPSLLRHVRQYIEKRTLINLPVSRQIVVKGPEFVEARVAARIVPTWTDKADEAKLAVIDNLEAFLHPLTGGPQGEGWDLGRDVYLSEIYAVIEQTAGVDHVIEAALDCSIMQWNLTLASPLPQTVSDGSRVTTFDERLRLVLARTVKVAGSSGTKAGTLCNQDLSRIIPVSGFKVGDRVDVVDTVNQVQVKGPSIKALIEDGSGVLFDQAFAECETLPPVIELALLARDGSIRLPLVAWKIVGGMIIGASLQLFDPAVDSLCILAEGRRFSSLEFLDFTLMSPRRDSVAVPRGHLVYSGTHAIETVLEE